MLNSPKLGNLNYFLTITGAPTRKRKNSSVDSKRSNFDGTDTESTTTSTISTAEIRFFVDKLKNERNRALTRHNYHGIWKQFNEFFIKLDEKPESWEDRLILFVGYLVTNDLKSNTIKSYISAIKSVLKEDGIELNENRFLLNSLTKACKYRNDHKVRTRLPIRKPLLELLLSEVKLKYKIQDGQKYLCKLYCALFASAYYGLLRVSELTAGAHPILAVDVHIGVNKNKILFILRTSKTHWKDKKPQLVKISSTRISTENKRKICPFTAIREFIDVRPDCVSYDEPFFIFQDRTPLTPVIMRSVLKELIQNLGLNPNNYGTHGFRIGRTLDLANFGLSVESIKFLGRWSSNCVFTYLSNI